MADQTTTTTTIDLRGYGERAKNNAFTLDSIYFSPEQDNGDKMRIPKMIVIEKQPKLPYYWADAGNFVAEAGNEIVMKLLGFGKAGQENSRIVKKIGEGTTNATLAQAGEVAGKLYANTVASSISRNPSSYWGSSKKYLNHLENLFSVEEGSENGIKTYELPFMSDYFMSADGSAGWRSEGANTLIGKLAELKIAKSAGINYPVTPSWEYQPEGQSVNFEFTLINDNSDHLKKNLKFLLTVLPGMMMVVLNPFGDTASKAGSLGEAASYFTSIYKSPNVYEVIVPGRFRWLWSTMTLNATCIGKFYHDSSLATLARAYGIGEENLGMPEAFKIEVTVKSLLPTTFNEFVYFLDSGNVDPTTSTQGSGKEAWKGISEFIEGKTNLAQLNGEIPLNKVVTKK